MRKEQFAVFREFADPQINVKNKHRIMSSEGFSALKKKKKHDMFSEGNAADSNGSSAHFFKI